jgi:hypothetical protein
MFKVNHFFPFIRPMPLSFIICKDLSLPVHMPSELIWLVILARHTFNYVRFVFDNKKLMKIPAFHVAVVAPISNHGSRLLQFLVIRKFLRQVSSRFMKAPLKCWGIDFPALETKTDFPGSFLKSWMIFI